MTKSVTLSTSLILVMLLFAFQSQAQTGIPVSQMSTCDELVEDFITTYEIPGATMALAKNGKLVYLRAFGEANIAGDELTQPYHRFRIASVSKPITSVAIMQMIENGDLELTDLVFGEGGILENHPVFSTAEIDDDDIYLITVQNLLEHSAGWDQNTVCTPNPTAPYPFQFGHCDPIGFPLHVSYVNGTSNPVSEEDLILFLLEKGLDFTPNTAYSYSNIGYLVLGEIIEELSGLSYEDYLNTNVFFPLGIYDMSIAKNLLEDKQEREGEYIGNGYTIWSCYGTGEDVPWEYGGFNIEAMDAHGGWISSARDLVRLLVAVDGFDTKPDILDEETINTMVTPSENFEYYAKGWTVNAYNNWWHTGALDGTATVFARTNGGYTWAILLNKRVIGDNSQSFWTDFDGIPWGCISSTSSFPSHDLMDLPTEPATDLEFYDITGTSVEVQWSSGDGEKRLVVISGSEESVAFPLDGTEYLADNVFGQGDDLGESTYVVYNGEGTSVNLSGLEPNMEYFVRVYEFNQSENTGNYPLYLLGGSASFSFTTSTGTGVDPNMDNLAVELYPSFTRGKLTVQVLQAAGPISYSIFNLSGVNLEAGKLESEKNTLDVSRLSKGFYTMVIHYDGKVIRKKFVKMDK